MSNDDVIYISSSSEEENAKIEDEPIYISSSDEEEEKIREKATRLYYDIKPRNLTFDEVLAIVEDCYLNNRE